MISKDGKVPIAIVAFFSKSGQASPSCDGFYQYTPETRALQEFIKTRDGWLRNDIGQVIWIDSKAYRLNGRVYRLGGG